MRPGLTGNQDVSRLGLRLRRRHRALKVFGDVLLDHARSGEVRAQIALLNAGAAQQLSVNEGAGLLFQGGHRGVELGRRGSRPDPGRGLRQLQRILHLGERVRGDVRLIALHLLHLLLQLRDDLSVGRGVLRVGLQLGDLAL